MHKKVKKLLVWSLVVSMVLTNMLFSNFAFAATKSSALASARLAGADRYQTAVEISKAEWTTSQYAVLAYGEGFADALAAAPLAGKYDAPILLTQKDSIPAAVLDELKRLGVKNVFVVGGEGVVSKAVADALVAAGMTPERLAGADRYATALAVANKLGTTTEVVVAYGEGFADALSISAIAAAKGMPILLTDKAAMSADVKAYIGTKKAYVVGGEGVVSAAVFNGLTGAVRLSGADRYATNLAVLQQFAAEMNWKNVFVATGEGFADALAGSALAARYGSPVVLADSAIAAATSSFLAGKVTSDTGVIAFGGAAVVSDSVVGSVKPSAPASVGIESVTTLGLNGIRVKFSQEVDKDSAVNDLSKYQLDGVNLDANDTASLASDNKTMTIILGSTKTVDQYKKKLFTIKDKVVLSKDTLTSIPKFEKELTFSDTAVPTVEKVSVSGNRKLTVTFSEPVKMAASRAAGISGYGSYFKIDGNYLSSYGFSTATTTVLTNDGFGFKVDLNFDVAVPAGAHTLKTLKGDSSHFADKANYFLNETDTSFTVETIATAPQVVSVTGETNGTILVTFDRAMATNSMIANNVVIGKFGVNGDAASNTVYTAAIKDNSDDKVIKVKAGTAAAAGTLNQGANVITIDNEIKDAWGNKLHADTDQRYSFTVSKDTTKPAVASVVMIANDKLRIKFSEDVDSTFATNKSNYTLKDSSGVTKDITTAGYATIAPEPSTSLDTYTLTINAAAGYKLTGSNYTLKIKNVVDLASPANTMDEYVATVNGIDDVAPEVVNNGANPPVYETVLVSGSTKKVAVYFTESMDTATATDPANYAYIDTNAPNKTHSLPSSSVITMGDTGKFVTIEFPSGYTVTPTVNVAAAPASDYYVQKVRVSNVKDLAGNVLKDISVIANIVANDVANYGKPEYSANTFKVFKDSTSTRAEIEFNQVLTTFNRLDFSFTGTLADGTTPVIQATSGYVSGKKVVLEFDDTVKYTLMGFGPTAKFYCAAPTSTNQSGVTLTAIAAGSAKVVWDDQIKPALRPFVAANGSGYVGVTSSTVAFLTNEGIAASAAVTALPAGTTTVVLKFSEKVDSTVSGLYADDFTFTQNGILNEVDAVYVEGNCLVFTFKAASMPVVDASKRLTVKAKSTVDVKDVKDSAGAADQNTYAPSTDDQNGRYWN